MSDVPPEADRYRLVEATPSVADYCRLRRDSGLTPRSEASAEVGLAGGILSVCVLEGEAVVGMGRVVGDGALFFQLVDIAVDPAHQGRGLGKAIVGALMARLRTRIPAEAYVSLIAPTARRTGSMRNMASCPRHRLRSEWRS